MMKLFFSPPSPYARKVRVLVRELGLLPRVQEVEVQTTPVAPAPELTAVNPLSRIPTLVMDNGDPLFDSRVISQYLASLAPDSFAFRNDQGPQRWASLRRQALADGMLDAALARRYEMALRPKELHWAPWLDNQLGKVTRGLAMMAADVPAAWPELGLDAIAYASALGWIEFRMPEITWRQTHPPLAALCDALAERASFIQTKP